MGIRSWIGNKLGCGCHAPLVRARWRRRPYICDHGMAWFAASSMGAAGTTYVWWSQVRCGDAD